jgi:hypothetical protein
MASTYSSLKIQLMGTGENSGTWGTITNTNLGTALEEAIVGSANVNFSSADVTLTLTDSNSSQAARNLRLNLTGSVAAPQNLIVPAIEKIYIINNGLTQTITVKNATGNGISVPAGKTEYVYNNGTDVVEAINHLTSLTLDTALPISSGGTGTNSTTYANLQSNVSGVLPVANGGTGSNSATFSGANITSLNASALASGTVPDARFPATLPATSGANLTSLNASALASGTVPDARFPATLPASSGANLTSLNASNIASGTVPTARLGSGTANNTTFLRGDSTYATISAGLPGQQAQIFTSSGTFTVPAGVTAVTVQCVGGGGGGGSNTYNGENYNSGNTGGRGGSSIGYVTGLTSGGTVSVTVGGAGNGAPASNGASGNPGGASSFGSSVLANGGSGPGTPGSRGGNSPNLNTALGSFPDYGNGGPGSQPGAPGSTGVPGLVVVNF